MCSMPIPVSQIQSHHLIQMEIGSVAQRFLFPCHLFAHLGERPDFGQTLQYSFKHAGVPFIKSNEIKHPKVAQYLPPPMPSKIAENDRQKPISLQLILFDPEVCDCGFSFGDYVARASPFLQDQYGTCTHLFQEQIEITEVKKKPHVSLETFGSKSQTFDSSQISEKSHTQ